jgi:alginate O-acetyltransferase complex protein AlgI
MIFSSPIFLFLFLPTVLTLFFLLGRSSRKIVLIAASLLFYAWGGNFLYLILLSILINYLLALLIDRVQKATSERPGGVKLVLLFAVLFNVGLLAFFKYTPFLVENLNALSHRLGLSALFMVQATLLPLGLSFYTFRAISYLVDVYRRKIPSARNLLDFALYLSFFPLLMAGPIVRYDEMPVQMLRQKWAAEKTAVGIKRFIFGLGKKCLVADTLAGTVDWIFSLPPEKITWEVAWLGILAYTIQIYFDFSGYSDMAIGLGKMFGYDLPENFNYPYIAQSIRDFWRRWHITLSTWFRDYLYIPLGGNRLSPFRVYANLILVFFICGLWHGAAWKFILWGLWHGFFLALERTGFGRLMQSLWRPWRHLYVLLVVVLGWVLFRSETLTYALHYLQALSGFSKAASASIPIGMILTPRVKLALLSGLIFSAPVYPALLQFIKRRTFEWGTPKTPFETPINSLGSAVIQAAVFLASIMSLAGTTYFPFIYFKF